MAKRRKRRRRLRKGGGDEDRREERRKKFKENLKDLERDVSRPGSYGEIPKPVIRWLDDLGGTPDEGKVFIVDRNGKLVDPTTVRKPCPAEYWVAFHDHKPTKRACKDVDFYDWVTESAEESALVGAEPLMKACEADGCRVRITVEYEWWECYVELGRSVVYCDLVLKIECFQI